MISFTLEMILRGLLDAARSTGAPWRMEQQLVERTRPSPRQAKQTLGSGGKMVRPRVGKEHHLHYEATGEVGLLEPHLLFCGNSKMVLRPSDSLEPTGF